MARILVGTSEGLHELVGAGAPKVQRIGWDDSPASVTSLARSGTEVLGVVGRHEIWRTSGGREWSHVVTLGTRCAASPRPTPACSSTWRGRTSRASPQGRVLASQDEGSSWDEVAGGLPPIECLLVTP